LDHILKHLQSVLKSVSTNTLLYAQLEALKQGWDASRDIGELKDLSNKFVLQHNVRPDSRSFAGILTHGIMFAVQQPPAKLDFLHALVPFVQRASIDDLKATSVSAAAVQDAVQLG
jgi:hypothetical protein